jgi:uroporphyrin-III C-methyltransferase/precorrin-2 dehydrogenase/sirohydrochlorin ferrochelatase
LIAPVSNLFPYYPVFMDLAGRSVVLIGADAAMVGLARQFLAAGAGVTTFDPAPTDAMRALTPTVRLKLRRWRAVDFQGASLVVCGMAEPHPSRARLAARAAQAVFHMRGAPENSDVVLGGVAASGALAVGVAAPGAPWAVTQAVRTRLEAALPAGLPQFLEAAAHLRTEVGRRIPNDAARAQFWSEACEAAFAAPVRKVGEWEAELRRRLPAA